MGEAWSDWYAMDFIMKSCVTASNLPRTDCWDADIPGTPDVWIGQGVQGGPGDGIRSQPLDCPADNANDGNVCSGGNTPHYGGYTYADFGLVCSCGKPEVHADGEIWAETLWQLRQAIGAANYPISENLITRALELSPPDPSFLDERDAILLADRIAYGGVHVPTIWSVFANRGMGWSASTTGSADTTPIAATDLPPAASAVTTGTVHDPSGAPVPGATITAAGHADLQAGVDGGGNYAISLPGGTYNLIVSAPGYEPA